MDLGTNIVFLRHRTGDFAADLFVWILEVSVQSARPGQGLW